MFNRAEWWERNKARVYAERKDARKALAQGDLPNEVRGKLAKRTLVRDDGCWEWIGTKDKNGYGLFMGVGAHRLSWLACVGPIPEGLTIDHLCRNTSCVNPMHLEPVTLLENLRRSYRVKAAREAKTCKHGHEWRTNATTNAQGLRVCRTCRLEACRRYDVTSRKRKRKA